MTPTVEAAPGFRPKDVLILTELQLDALGEAFNISLGEAAATFSMMVCEEIELSVPQVEIVDRDSLARHLRAATSESEGEETLCSIAQRFESEGTFSTETMVIFPESGCIEIVRRMLGGEASLERITELEQDALAEIGNVIINGCMSSLANLLRREMIGTLPEVLFVTPDELVAVRPDAEQILVARVGMHMSVRRISGFVLFMMSVAAIRNFVEGIDAAFDA